MYRIAIIGSQCTGKSTVADSIAKKLKLPQITEVAREFDANLFINRSKEDFAELQKKILDLQLEEESKLNEFVSDRSTVDNMAYWIHNCSDNTTKEENERYINKALSNIKNYTHIFQLVPEFYPIDDGFRDTNIVYHLQIAETIRTILFSHRISHYTLRGTNENRVNTALKILRM